MRTDAAGLLLFASRHEPPRFPRYVETFCHKLSGEPERPEWPLYLDYMGLQLDELLTRYGSVAELWFDSVDMRVQAEYDGQRFLDQVRRLQPETVVNNRLGVPADFITPEQFIPKAIPVKGVRMDSPDHSQPTRWPSPFPVPRNSSPGKPA